MSELQLLNTLLDLITAGHLSGISTGDIVKLPGHSIIKSNRWCDHSNEG